MAWSSFLFPLCVETKGLSAVHQRERLRHELAFRRLRVSETSQISAHLRRVRLVGDDLAGFTAPGPSDHVKLFLPDANGQIIAPLVADDGSLQRPEGTPTTRDYTPRAVHTDAAGVPVAIDIDFVLHEGGPATEWARRATPGDEIVVAGPRGSKLAPTAPGRVALVADPSAFPAFVRWVEALPQPTVIDAVIWNAAAADAEYFDESVRARLASLQWVSEASGDAGLLDAVRSLELPEGAFVWAAGEAQALIAVRRLLREQPQLDRADIDVSGYWKRGVIALDHHAPLDPSDPE